MIALSLGVLAALCWGGHDLAAKRFSADIGPYRMTLLVMALGAALLLPVVVWNGTILNAGLAGCTTAIVMGLFYAAAVGGLFKAFSLAPASIVGPFTAGYPALVVIWNISQGLSPTIFEWSALVLCCLGAVVVARLGPADGGINIIAKGKLNTVIVAAAIASLSFAATVVIGQKGATEIGPLETTFISRFSAFVAILPFALREGALAQKMSGFAWGGLMFMSALDVAAVSAVNASGLFAGAEFSAMGISLYGGIVPFLAWLILKEKVTIGQWLGIALIIAGVGLLALPK